MTLTKNLKVIRWRIRNTIKNTNDEYVDDRWIDWRLTNTNCLTIDEYDDEYADDTNQYDDDYEYKYKWRIRITIM